MRIATNHRILVVDDNREILEYIHRGLTHHGYDVRVVDRATKALNLLENNEFQFALIDIRLPGMDGLELSDRIVADFPKVIIILMTGYPEIQHAMKVLKNQIFDYIIKPFRIQQLLIAIRRADRFSQLLKENTIYRDKIAKLRKENESLQIELRRLFPAINFSNSSTGSPKQTHKNVIDLYKKQQRNANQKKSGSNKNSIS